MNHPCRLGELPGGHLGDDRYCEVCGTLHGEECAIGVADIEYGDQSYAGERTDWGAHTGTCCGGFNHYHHHRHRRLLFHRARGAAAATPSYSLQGVRARDCHGVKWAYSSRRARQWSIMHALCVLAAAAGVASGNRTCYRADCVMDATSGLRPDDDGRPYNVTVLQFTVAYEGGHQWMSCERGDTEGRGCGVRGHRDEPFDVTGSSEGDLYMVVGWMAVLTAVLDGCAWAAKMVRRRSAPSRHAAESSYPSDAASGARHSGHSSPSAERRSRHGRRAHYRRRRVRRSRQRRQAKGWAIALMLLCGESCTVRDMQCMGRSTSGADACSGIKVGQRPGVGAAGFLAGDVHGRGHGSAPARRGQVAGTSDVCAPGKCRHDYPGTHRGARGWESPARSPEALRSQAEGPAGGADPRRRRKADRPARPTGLGRRDASRAKRGFPRSRSAAALLTLAAVLCRAGGAASIGQRHSEAGLSPVVDQEACRTLGMLTVGRRGHRMGQCGGKGLWGLVERHGEAKNPGPGDGRTAELSRGDGALAEAMVAAKAAWASWARCVRARSSVNEGTYDAQCADRGVRNAASLALAAAIRLAQARVAWQREQGTPPANEEGDHDPHVPAVGRRRRGQPTDKLAVHSDDSQGLAQLKRKLRQIEATVKGIVAPSRPPEDAATQLKGQVQQAVDLITEERRVRQQASAVGSVQAATPRGQVSRPADLSQFRALASGARGPSGQGTRGGRGEHAKPQTLKVIFGNVNSLSEKAEAHMINDGSDVWIAAESHVRDGKRQAAVRRLAAGGWRCTYVDAVESESGGGGTQGGVVAAAKAHLGVRPMWEDRWDGTAWQAPTRDLIGRNVPLRGTRSL